MQATIPSVGTLPPSVPSETRPTFGSQPSPPQVPNGSRPRGMQLGTYKTPGLSVLPGGLAEEARWGGDLMDVNADEDDWSTYPRLS
jgi:SCY1-like protein 1